MLKHGDHFPFEKLVTHRFPLPEYTYAMTAVKQEDCVKAIFVPDAKSA
jgi:hypothetical protein